jgi:glucosamine-6-phosphate deaminase
MLSQKEIEKIPTQIFKTSEAASIFVANEIATLIRSKQKEGKPCVLGLATGSTPTRVYSELISS